MRYPETAVRRFGEAVLQKAGMSGPDARICTDVLLTADLRGVPSHGMTHLGDLVARMEQGTLDPAARVEVVQTAPATVKINGHHCAGMISGHLAMEKCVELAGTTGIAMATICNANTCGLGAYYPLQAVSRGMIGFAVTRRPMWPPGAERIRRWGRTPSPWRCRRESTRPLCWTWPPARVR